MSAASDLRLGDLVTYTIEAERREDYIRQGVDSPWVTRSDQQHVAIVIQFLADDDVRVWDTVENDWWVASAENLQRVPR